MKVTAAILAAGQGSRFGADKSQVLLKGKPLWRHSFDTFLSHPDVDSVGVVCSSAAVGSFRSSASRASFVVSGGGTRQQSAKNAVQAATGCDILLIHDGARPLISHHVISRIVEAVIRSGAAAPAVPVTETIRRRSSEGFETVDRDRLVAMQTPQGARWELLDRAYREADEDFTDEMSLLQSVGVSTEIVEGDANNLKITTMEDLSRAASWLGPPELRTGIGYDVHPFSQDTARKCIIGGIEFDDAPGLQGHSDADVLLHAVVDALLGAAGLGDIGMHFPDTDEEWKGQSSIYFLERTKVLLKENGWRILNIDTTLIAEFPKIMKKVEAIRSSIAEALGLEPSRVSIKATTNERLGSIGRGEGIAAFSVATLCESARS